MATAANDEEAKAVADGTSPLARIADALREQGVTTVACGGRSVLSR